MTDPQDDKKQKGKSFKDIADLLKMDGSAGFDNVAEQNELAELEERKKKIQEFRHKFEKIQKLENVDDYMSNVLKELVGKGMTMLDSIQREIEDNPRGRDVETAAAMMTSINAIIDNINNIKVSNAKISFEQQKIDLKKSAGGPTMSQPTQNILMVGTTQELMDLFLQKKIIPDGNAVEIKSVEVIKENSKSNEEETE